MDDIQCRINDLHSQQLDQTRKLALELNFKKNAIFATRNKVITEKAPADFWLRVFRGCKDVADELMGKYDDAIFAAMTSFSVEHLQDGVRIEMCFRPNNFFSDEKLWYEEHEAPGSDPLPTVSGVNWKPGKGPIENDDNGQQQQQQASNPWAIPQQKESGQRRERQDEQSQEGRGPTFFEFFSKIPDAPQPPIQIRNNNNNNNNNNGEDDEEDEEGGDMENFEAGCDEWEEMIEDRRDIARCIVEEIWEDPVQFLGIVQQD